MVWTKKELIDAAFDELALGDGAYNMEPEQYKSAMMKLDAMLTLWAAKGVNLGWNSVSTPSQDPYDTNKSSNIPEFANEAVYLNLALRLANSYGRVVNQDCRSLASTAYRDLLNVLSRTPTSKLNGSTMFGAGDSIVGTTILSNPVDTSIGTNKSELEF